MEQRTYEGNVSPDALADYLVQNYHGQNRVQAQKIGQGDSLVVQIGTPREPDGRMEMHNALTLGIHRSLGASGLVVTMGEQQWITPELATYAAMMGLIGILITPWALFALIWPVSRMLGSRVLPNDVWNTVQTFAMSQGAMPGMVQDLAHPHVAAPAPVAYPPPAPAPTQDLGRGPATLPDEAKTQKLN